MNLLELEKRFSTQRKCEKFLQLERWPGGVTCPRCGANKPYYTASLKKWECRKCRYQFTVTAGTIFHRSRTPLKKWFIAIYLMCVSKKGISAKQLQRTIGVTYKTAWRMGQQIRKAMKHANFEDKLAGIVEMDDVYIECKKSGGKRGRGAPGKTSVVGMKSRGGDVMAFVVANLKADTLEKLIRNSVSTKAEMLITDELKSYKK
ncbi:IS1595 family transposase, partial [Candidatus Bipolaricaulota bacterium]|nr:IS1595 family transposase [Candidatus Bipolaricaulota bacterium]